MAIYPKLQEEIRESNFTGFIDHGNESLTQYQPKLLVNNSREGKKVLTNLIKELKNCDEFFFSVAFVTNSGVAALINTLKELENNNIKGTIIASQYDNFTEPRALLRLLQFSNIDLRVITEGNFHAKGYVFKKDSSYTIIIGSSNLTSSALSSNKEWNLKVSSLDKGGLVTNTITEFETLLQLSTKVTEEWIIEYDKIYQKQKYIFDEAKEAENQILGLEDFKKISPNKMQIEALQAIENLRSEGKNKALLISATGTGKTYLSAFDVSKVNPKRFLFVIHRENIARAAMKTFKKVFGKEKTMSLLTGHQKEFDSDYIFATIQTLSKREILHTFPKDHFDYIVFDEAHHSGANTYQVVMNYFQPKFLLGMTATPERTDGNDIFKAFDYNIAYEIRLHDALEENMLVPFHYYGIKDIEIDGELLDEFTDFNRLICSERIEKILENSRFYGCDQGRIRGLIFCSTIKEAEELSIQLNEKGCRTQALTGSSSEEEREKCIRRLESRDSDYLDYILSVDIFNEGVDIPSVNQIIMLRPTQSAIVFVQQMGRGLRKNNNKDFLTIIDFIGNYANNYMVPIALFGDNSYNKDSLRKLVANGSCFIPGSSTINFDEITEKKIFESISSAKIDGVKDFKKDYDLLKFKLGVEPKMMDFIIHGSRDPFTYIEKFNSFANFVYKYYNQKLSLSSDHYIKLEFFSKEVCNGKRIEDILIMAELLKNEAVSYSSVKEKLFNKCGIELTIEIFNQIQTYMNCAFHNLSDRKKYYSKDLLVMEKDSIKKTEYFTELLKNLTFKNFLEDLTAVAALKFEKSFNPEKYNDGFILYEKYTRKDVCRILNWLKDESSVLYGYRLKYNTCPIFVTYRKSDDVSKSIRYEDYFIDNNRFHWMSRNRVTKKSKDIDLIDNQNKNSLRIPLFIKKSDDKNEGKDFYYIGDLKRYESIEDVIENDKGQKLSIVNINFNIEHTVEDHIMNYLTKDLN